jgi:DNA-binding SARP family transcriptional activator
MRKRVVRFSVKKMQLRHSRQSLSQSSSDGTVIQLWLLGPMQMYVVAGEVPLAARKSRALLVYLATKRGIPVPRQTLIGLLWGDRSEDQARASLRQTLSALRKDLGEDAAKRLTTVGDSVTLAVEGVWVDADELEQASDKSSAESLESAAALFRGDLVEGLAVNEPAFDHWLAAERERIRAQMLRVLMELVSRLEQENRIEDAITHCAKALALDPFQEKMHRLLIGFYMKQGRHDAALAQFEQCRRTLADQLGVAPEQETLDLVAEVKVRRRQISGKPVVPATPADMHDPVPQLLTVHSAAPSLPDKPSLAVLPFTNMSADPEQDFFFRRDIRRHHHRAGQIP